MKEKIFNDIKDTDLCGLLHPDEAKRFDDRNFFTKENLFQYRLSKLKFFLGDKNGKELILGLQTLYTNANGKEIVNEEARDKEEKELDIKIFEIPSNDYIRNFILKIGDERITQIQFHTKKDKTFVVGSDETDNIILNFNEDNKDNIFLYFFGGYRKCLECMGAGYIPIQSYLGNTRGYFDLKIKLKNKSFKKTVESKFNSLSSSDKILFRVCNLPNSCFNSIIKFCLF